MPNKCLWVSNSLIFLLLVGALSQMPACRTATESLTNKATVEVPTNFKLLDSTEAAQVIIVDEKEGFFEKISIADMQIQMKYQHSAYETNERDYYLKAYREYLQQDVRDFSPDEVEFVTARMKKATQLCALVNPKLCGQAVQLIKTGAMHYGEGAFYTRENAIIVPFNAVVEMERNEADFTETMLHELFHIYSRSHPKLRNALYELIGFYPIENFELPQKLKEQRLMNPDGIDIGYAIDTKDEKGRAITAIPLIYTLEKGYSAKEEEFFSYLEFSLFEIQKTGSGWNVLTNETGVRSIHNVENMPHFFKTIGPNTDYILHPDEILADNFAILALSKEDPTMFDDLEPAGKKLLKEIEAVLSAF